MFLSVVGIIFHKIRASLHLLLVLGGPVLAIIYERNHKKFPIVSAGSAQPIWVGKKQPI